MASKDAVGRKSRAPGTPRSTLVMLERFAVQFADVEPDRVRAEGEEQAAHPRLELGGPQAGDRRAARIRPAGDVQDGQPADRRQVTERDHQADHELPHDRLDMWLGRDLGGQAMARIELSERAGQ